MSGFAKIKGIDSLANQFKWSSVTNVVDVGGGRGEVCIGLAERFGNLRFTVQDLQHVIEGRPAPLSEATGSRIQYMTHNYFSVQTVKDADIYFFRYIFHDLPDEYCVKLLQAQIPGASIGVTYSTYADKSISIKTGRAHHNTKCRHFRSAGQTSPLQRKVPKVCLYAAGSPIVLSDLEDRVNRSFDLVMLTFFGSRERTLKEWKDMIRQADERFEVNYTSPASGPPSDVLDLVWRGAMAGK